MNFDWKLKYGFIGLVIGVVLIFFASDFFSYLKDPITITADNVQSLKEGDHVKMDVRVSLGASITVTTTETKYGNSKSKESNRYYMVPFFNLDFYPESLLTVKVVSDDFNSWEKITDDFWDFYEGKDVAFERVIPIEGIVKKMGDEELKYAKEAVIYYFGSEKGVFWAPLYVNFNNYSSSLGILILACVFIVVSGLLLGLGIRKTIKEKKERAEARELNAGYYAAPTDVTFNNDQVDPRFANLVNNPMAHQNMNFNEVSPSDSNQNTLSFNDVPNAPVPTITENTDTADNSDSTDNIQ